MAKAKTTKAKVKSTPRKKRATPAKRVTRGKSSRSATLRTKSKAVAKKSSPTLVKPSSGKSFSLLGWMKDLGLVTRKGKDLSPTATGIVVGICAIFLIGAAGVWIARSSGGSSYVSEASSSKENYSSQRASMASDQPYLSQFKTANQKSMGDRVKYWADFLISQRGLNRQLPKFGKFPNIQDDAPVIPERYDCTTYVETVMALARSRSSEDFFNQLMKVRYKNSSSRFENRNHFPTADWIPNNVEAGILADITDSIAEKADIDFEIQTKAINKERWLKGRIKRKKIGRSIASRALKKWSQVEASVKYIPIDRYSDVLPHLPQGAVLNLVRQNVNQYDVQVSHQGFIIRKGNKVYLRHSTTDGRLRTTDLEKYLKDQKKKSWTVIGFNVNEVKGE